MAHLPATLTFSLSVLFVLLSVHPVHSKSPSVMLGEMQNKILTYPQYSDFVPFFYNSSAPLDLFFILKKKSITLLVPSNKALQSIPRKYFETAQAFGDLVMYNSVYGKVTIHDFVGASVGKKWTSLYKSRDVTKVALKKKPFYGLTFSNSVTTASVTKILKGNMNRQKQFYCHGVDSYALPK